MWAIFVFEYMYMSSKIYLKQNGVKRCSDMYKVVSFDLSDSVFCLKVHYKSHVDVDCLSFMERHPTMNYHVLDSADQFCDISTSETNYLGEGACFGHSVGVYGLSNEMGVCA